MFAGDGVFFLAAQTIHLGLTFFDDPAARYEVVSDPVDVGGGLYLATVRALGGPQPGVEMAAALHVGHRVK